MFAGTGTRWDPTVGNTAGDWLTLQEEPEGLVNEKFRAFFPKARLEEERTRNFPWRMKMFPKIFAQQLESISAAYSHGVRLHAGTDAPEHLSFPGQSLHWELEHLARAGIPLLEVLRIATQEAAIAVGAGDDLGTLAAGNLADMVLLDANPLDDIKNTQTIWRVIKGGWVFDPEELRPPASTNADR